jgi:hypothetical protein
MCSAKSKMLKLSLNRDKQGHCGYLSYLHSDFFEEEQ